MVCSHLFPDLDYATGPVSAGGYRAVPFSYGSADEPAGENNANAESAFRPPFSLPENLLQNLVSICLAVFFWQYLSQPTTLLLFV